MQNPAHGPAVVVVVVVVVGGVLLQDKIAACPKIVPEYAGGPGQ